MPLFSPMDRVDDDALKTEGGDLNFECFEKAFCWKVFFIIIEGVSRSTHCFRLQRLQPKKALRMKSLFTRALELFSPSSGELTRDYCVPSYRKKRGLGSENPQHFVKKG